MPLYNSDASRSAEQADQLHRLAAANVCMFCSSAYYPRAAILSGTHWYVAENDYPYEGTDAHYLVVSHAHVTHFNELPDEAGAELWAHQRNLKHRLNPVASASVMRSGDLLYNGGSVAHLHVHFVALGENPSKTVKFRVSAREA
jgi:ATP adenylyltransferase